MGLISRLRKSPRTQSAAPSVTEPAAGSRLSPLLVGGAMNRLVVGWSYYPKAYRGLRVGSTVTATLRAQPQNSHDANAVAVFLDGVPAGHIGHDAAAELQPVVMRCEQAGYLVQAQGSVEALNSEKTIRLHLPWLHEIDSWLRLPAPKRAKGYTEPVNVSLKRLNDYQGALGEVLAGRNDLRTTASLSLAITERGKYAGKEYIRAAIDDVGIGLIPAQYREDCGALFELVEAGETDFEVYVRQGEDRIWAALSVR